MVTWSRRAVSVASGRELPAERQFAQHGRNLDVERVRSGHLADEGVEQLGIEVAAHEGLDHGRGVDHLTDGRPRQR
jgi:hypothetical protein